MNKSVVSWLLNSLFILSDDYLGDNYEENEKHTEEVGTELYMSPEQLAKKPYNNKVDIYSLGLILYELLVPFSTQMERIHTLTKLRQLEFPAKFKETPEYSLVKTMLDHDPSERPESSAILDMDFLSQAVIGEWNFQFRISPTRWQSPKGQPNIYFEWG